MQGVANPCGEAGKTVHGYHEQQPRHERPAIAPGAALPGEMTQRDGVAPAQRCRSASHSD